MKSVISDHVLYYATNFYFYFLFIFLQMQLFYTSREMVHLAHAANQLRDGLSGAGVLRTKELLTEPRLAVAV